MGEGGGGGRLELKKKIRVGKRRENWKRKEVKSKSTVHSALLHPNPNPIIVLS